MLNVALGAYLTSAFGMNLDNGVGDDSIWLFWGLAIGITLMIAVFSWLIISYYRVVGILPARAPKLEVGVW